MDALAWKVEEIAGGFGKVVAASELKGRMRLRNLREFWSKWGGAGGVRKVAGNEGDEILKEADWDLVTHGLGE